MIVRRALAKSLAPQPASLNVEMSEYIEKSTSASTISIAFAPRKHVKRAIKVISFFIIVFSVVINYTLNKSFSLSVANLGNIFETSKKKADFLR